MMMSTMLGGMSLRATQPSDNSETNRKQVRGSRMLLRGSLMW